MQIHSHTVGGTFGQAEIQQLPYNPSTTQIKTILLGIFNVNETFLKKVSSPSFLMFTLLKMVNTLPHLDLLPSRYFSEPAASDMKKMQECKV